MADMPRAFAANVLPPAPLLRRGRDWTVQAPRTWPSLPNLAANRCMPLRSHRPVTA
jgi:hypothetical protein